MAESSDQPISYLPHFAKGALINFSGGLSRMVLLYMYTLLLARMLTVSGLGEYFLMFSIINILGLASVVGLDFGLIRYIALYAGNGDFASARRVLRASLLLGGTIGVLTAVALVLLAPVLNSTFFNDSETAVAGLRIFSLSIPFLVVARMYNATTQAMHRMQYQVFSRDLGEQISKLLLSVGAIVLGAQLIGVVWANVVSICFGAMLSLIFASLVLPKPAENIAITGRPERELFRYSFPLAFSNILCLVLLWIDILLLGYLTNSTDVGFYGAALRVATASTAVTVAFSTVFAPVIPELYEKGHLEQLSVLFKTVSKWIFACSFPIFLVLALFADPIMRLFGSDFSSGSVALILLAFGQLLSASAGPTGFMILMSGHSRVELLNMAVALGVNVSLCVLLIPRYGIIGAAMANMFSAAVLVSMRATEVWIFMRINAFDRGIIKPLLAGSLVAGALALLLRYVITNIGLGLTMVLSITLFALYVLAILAMGLDEHDETVLRLVKARLLRVRGSTT